MANRMNIIAALCAKANDAAFANEISIAVGRCQGQQEEPSPDQEDDPADFIATLCVKASAFRLEDHRCSSGTPEAPKENDDCPSFTNNGHKISNMHPESFPALLKSMETMTMEEEEEEDDLQDGFTILRRSSVAGFSSIGEESSSSLFTDRMRRNSDGSAPSTKSIRRRPSKSEHYTADVVEAALESCQDASPEKSQRTRSGKSRDLTEAAASSSSKSQVKKRGSLRLLPQKSKNERKCLDSCSTDSPTGEDLSYSSKADDDDVPTDEELRAIGWRKVLDGGSGKYYYYTADRSKVMWHNPIR